MISSLTHAQDELSHSIKMDFKLPTATHNSAFKSIHNGVSDVSLSYQYPLVKGFGIGAGVVHTYMQVDEFAINTQALISGRVHRLSPFGKIFYEGFLNQYFVLDIGVKAGYSALWFKSNYCRDSGEVRQGRGFFLEPYIGLYMPSKNGFNVGLILGYSITGYEYTPADLCQTSLPGYASDSYLGNINTFSIGFGFAAFLGQGDARR